MLTAKLTELLSDLNDHMEFIENSTRSNGASGTPSFESENGNPKLTERTRVAIIDV